MRIQIAQLELLQDRLSDSKSAQQMLQSTVNTLKESLDRTNQRSLELEDQLEQRIIIGSVEESRHLGVTIDTPLKQVGSVALIYTKR